MSMFGKQIQLRANAPQKVAPAQPQGAVGLQGNAPPRRGMFGHALRFFTPERMQIIGHTLQEMGGQQGALDGYLAQRSAEQTRTMQQQREALENRREDAGWERAEVQERALHAWVETLSPQQRDAARVNPQAAYQAFMSQQAQSAEWETNGTQPYRIGPNGDVIMGSGNIPHRPRQGAQGYNTPDADDWEAF